MLLQYYQYHFRLNGISHFVEHLVFKGTKNRSDREISQSIEGVGGILNASTAEEITFYYSQVPREKFALALEVLLDIVVNPTFKEEYLEKQRSIVLEEIHMYEDVDLTNSMLIDGFPTVGLVSTIVSSYIVDALNLQRVGGIISKEFPPASVVVGGVPSPPMRIYAGPKISLAPDIIIG